MDTQVSNNPLICPLCGEANHCAYAAGKPAKECWCMNLSIPKQLLAQIPDEQRMKSCVCEACVRAFLTEKERQ
ncbi:cysteine-rich CWC family protein [Paenibacillus sp. Marseille-Q4541]|uniref:cysteine-rich CWC family protein n=1 Tax=Paenibacillus sp. Marseille-Q4541 TaxID=2831522 RepID=UPI001BA4B72E|nr:cysteine-rich CWC family protein [Paenibacillus sp. Marseille-Q4541]